jgi:hypothetical protein
MDDYDNGFYDEYVGYDEVWRWLTENINRKDCKTVNAIANVFDYEDRMHIGTDICLKIDWKIGCPVILQTRWCTENKINHKKDFDDRLCNFFNTESIDKIENMPCVLLLDDQDVIAMEQFISTTTKEKQIFKTL